MSEMTVARSKFFDLIRGLKHACEKVMGLRPAPIPSARKRQLQGGFTLVEVLVVLGIIGLIMSLMGPRVLGYLTDSKVKTARIQAESLSSAVELFYIDVGRYPLDAEGLQALVVRPASVAAWNGPYIKGNSVPLDPWGKPYKYASLNRGRSYVINFAGPDGQPGNENPRQGAQPAPRTALNRTVAP